ncbi:hypothetical protein GQ53DRAFT_832049 [Thozetella sp. PMI_491]|nr:hypothetical protein GQ53DRAFT_832049 [Thozetella sp. PMI_491]
MKFPTLVMGSLLTTSLLAEEIHLVDCSGFSAFGGNTAWSEIIYYSNTPDSSIPPNDNRCQISGPWEGTNAGCGFPTGVHATSHIVTNGRSVGNFNWAGTADNDFGSFTCFKDDEHILFHQSTNRDGSPGWNVACKSIYYCIHL